MVVQDMIAEFLKNKLNIEQFSDGYVNLTNLCKSIGVSFEMLFYEKVMKDPQVRKELVDNQANMISTVD